MNELQSLDLLKREHKNKGFQINGRRKQKMAMAVSQLDDDIKKIQIFYIFNSLLKLNKTKFLQMKGKTKNKLEKDVM